MKEEHSGQPGKRKRVAFITDALSSTSFTQRILSGIALFIQKRRGIVLQQIPFNVIARDSLTGQFDGIIINLCAKETHALLDMLNGANLPIVDISAEVEAPALIRVDNDIVREGTMAAEWFLRRGFKNFAYCGFHGVDTYPFNDILENAFATAVEKAGHQCLMFNMPPVRDSRHRPTSRPPTAPSTDTPRLATTPSAKTRDAVHGASETGNRRTPASSL